MLVVVVVVDEGAGWDFGNTSKTTALPGVCRHFLGRTTPLPEKSPHNPLTGINREELKETSGVYNPDPNVPYFHIEVASGD